MKSLLLLSLILIPFSVTAAEYPPPVRALVQQGVQVEAQFDAGNGVTGYAGRVRGEPLALYLMPDGKHLIVGTMLDANGADLTHAHLSKYLPAPEYAQEWAQLEKATWVREGAASAKRVVYVFTDPECPYCNKLWVAMQPYVGKDLQVRHILVGLLKPTSLAKAAAILSSKNPAEALRQHETAHARGGIEPMKEIPAAVKQQIEKNNRMMAEMGIAGTPGVFYKDRQGKVRRVVGMPQPDVLKNEILQQAAR